MLSFLYIIQWLYLDSWLNLDNIRNENNKEPNKKWPHIPDHPYRILIIGSSGSGRTNTLPNIISEQDDDETIDKIYFHAKDLTESKYEFLIKNHKWFKHIYWMFK